MAHKFPFARRESLENDKRKEMLPARQTLSSLGLKEGDNLVDIGSGSGYFSFPALDIVGSEGSVLGLDIQKEFVEFAKSRIKDDQKNICFDISEENRFPGQDNSADAALLAIVLHEVLSVEKFLSEIKRILVSKGRLMIIEWKPVEMETGPPLHERIAPNSLAEILTKNGFIPSDPIELGPAHYGMTATAKD